MALKKWTKLLFFSITPWLKKQIYLSLKKLQWHKHGEYNSDEVQHGLREIGIKEGDSLYIMCSVKRIHEKVGRYIPVDLLYRDIKEVIGNKGTVLVLAFSDNREDIVQGKRLFDIHSTPVQRNGMLSRYLFNRPEAVRSLQPIFSVVAVGKDAEELCDSHHLSPYPYDEFSPFRKLVDKGGKYLGMGQGIEAFTPAHMIEDYFKQDFSEWVYSKEPLNFTCIDKNGQKVSVRSYIRGKFSKMLDLTYHFKQLNIQYHEKILSESGISLFTMNISEYLDASIKMYLKNGLTIWSSCLPRFFYPIVQLYRKLKYHFRQI